jgi:hypothetical protein
MHLIETLTGEAARTLATTRIPFGPGFSAEEAQTIHTLELHGSSCNDPGPDYCEFRAIDAQGQAFPPRRITGY